MLQWLQVEVCWAHEIILKSKVVVKNLQRNNIQQLSTKDLQNIHTHSKYSLSLTLLSHLIHLSWNKKEACILSLCPLRSISQNNSRLQQNDIWSPRHLCCTLTYRGSLRVSTSRLTRSSHTGFRFLWMVLLLNTSFPAILNFTYGSLVPTEMTHWSAV